MFSVLRSGTSRRTAAPTQPAFQQRLRLEGDPQECFWASYRLAGLAEAGHNWAADDAALTAAYVAAHAVLPTRAEPLHALARLARLRGEHQLALEHARRGLDLTPPSQELFVDASVYAFRLRDELAASTYALGDFNAALSAWDQILETKTPRSDHDRIIHNRWCAHDRLRERAGR